MLRFVVIFELLGSSVFADGVPRVRATGIFAPDVEWDDTVIKKPAPVIPTPKAVHKENYGQYSPWYEVIDGKRVPTRDSHLIHDHGVSPEELKGLTQAEKDRLHGKMHGEKPASIRIGAPIVMKQQTSNCPGGICPIQRTRRR